ncbi:MAG: hypothetical protein C0502_09540 [Opitutus sp.]|nr:hypothetical protein [Opitutus sp.]
MDTNTPPVAAPVAGTPEDKTVAILSYLTVIGFIVAIVLHGSKKTRLGSFHLRQSLGIYLTGVVAGACNFALVLIPILGWLAMLVIWLGLVVLWVMGLVGAAQGQARPVPVLGEQYQKLLGTAFD